MQRSLPSKIWYCVNPVIIMLVLNVLIFYGGTLCYQVFFQNAYADVDSFMDSYNSIISIICYIAGIIVFYILFKRDGFSGGKTLFEKWFYIPAVCVFGAAASHGLSILISLINIDGILGSYEESSQTLFAAGVILVVIRTVILAPVVEELIFRGLIYNRIKGYIGFWPAAIISAAIFGIYHLNLAQGIYAFLFGILFCLIYRRFENLLSCVFMHAAANLLSVILEFTGADYGAVYVYVIVMILCLVLSAAVYVTALRAPRE